ncbi:acyl--CoA ligase [Candidatus Gottesmanbacteria bacterium]|nr:acyl--CoA ligase [Candidatus Gottesmanbacteria bacterium]
MLIPSLDELLIHHAQTYGSKEAIIAVDPDSDAVETITYKDLAVLVARTAYLLAGQGIKPGDRFAILMHNTPEVLLFELAGASMGATTVPLDFKRDTLERKLFKLKDTNARALFVKYEGSPNTQDETAIKKAYPKLTVKAWSTFEDFQKLLPTKPPIRQLAERKSSLDSHYVILYTSGTTAHPRGVFLSTRACIYNALGIIDWQQFTDKDRFNIVLPLHHVNSTEFCLSMLLVGGTIILNTRYSASKFWTTIAKFRATNTSIVPTILHDLLVRHDEFEKQKPNISSLKRICIGSAPVMPEETLRFYKTFGVRVTQGYGQTETALRVAGVPIDVDEKTYEQMVKSNTIGTALAYNELAIMDPDNHLMAEGKEGEICIKGPVLADGYLNAPQATANTFKRGWFHSGDLGYWKSINGTKYFFIIGRIKEIIIKGGVNISPSAIEDALLKAFPQIDEVSVVGYPDERMGEEIAAVVVCQKRFALLERIAGISPYETPKKLFFTYSLPKTSTGKIQRVLTKQWVADKMKSEVQKHYYVRVVKLDEKDILKKAVAINNDRWVGLPATLKEFSTRAKNALLFGAFEEKEGLVGSISCLLLSQRVVDNLRTWDQATAHGALTNHDPKGDVLLCIAISVESSHPSLPSHPSHLDEKNLKKLAKQKIKDYINSDQDYVLHFHKKPKGGIAGATVWKILENGRPDDKEAMGYNVLMKYPTIDANTKIVRSAATTPSVLLIEQALLYAKEKGISTVIAFSRPAGFKDRLVSQSRR